MIPGANILGAAMTGVGALGSAFGQSKGLSAMSAEAGAQGARHAQGNADQQAIMRQEIDRRKQALMADAVAPEMKARQGALAGAGTLGRGMGLGQAQLAGVQASLMPSATAASYAGADRAMQSANRMGIGEMEARLTQARGDQNLASANNAAQLQRAGQSGAIYRQLGELLQQGGMAASGFGNARIMANMDQAAAKKAERPTYNKTGMSIFPMQVP